MFIYLFLKKCQENYQVPTAIILFKQSFFFFQQQN